MPKKKEIIEKKEEIKKDKNEEKKESTEKKNATKEELDKKVKEKVEKTDKVKSEAQKENTKKQEKNRKEQANTKELIIKEKPKELDETKLVKIEEEIKKQTTIPDEKKKKINKKIFRNVMIAIGIIVYFVFINLGFYNLESVKFLKDLQVFSIITIGMTIIIFEIAYKKDSGELAIYGVEALILSICTLLTIFILINYNNKFSYIINVISMLFSIYYVGKSIVIYVKMRKKALKRVSDIEKIRRVK